MVFCLKILGLKSACNHGTLQAKSTNFQGLVFVPKIEKLLLRCSDKCELWSCKVDVAHSNLMLFV